VEAGVTPTIEVVLFVAAFGTAACAYLARPKRKKPADLTAWRVARLRTAAAEANWRAAQAAHQKSEPARKVFVAARAEEVALEMRCRATGWRKPQ
jgi:hypothetical protein